MVRFDIELINQAEISVLRGHHLYFIRVRSDAGRNAGVA